MLSLRGSFFRHLYDKIKAYLREKKKTVNQRYAPIFIVVGSMRSFYIGNKRFLNHGYFLLICICEEFLICNFSKINSTMHTAYAR